MIKKRSKRYLENKKKVFEIKKASINDAIKTFKSNKTVKFDETLDISVMLNKEKNKGEGLSRGYVQLPNGTGKKIQIAVFATGEKVKEAKDAGADIVGNEDLIKVSFFIFSSTDNFPVSTTLYPIDLAVPAIIFAA